MILGAQITKEKRNGLIFRLKENHQLSDNVEKMAELGVFDDGVELGGDEFKKPELDDGSGIELFDTEIKNQSEHLK